MAAEDLTGYKDDTRTPLTAEQEIAPYGELANDVQNRQAAAAAGVQDAAYIDYDLALDAYAARTDIEDLAQRRARDFPADFADADFMRQAATPPASSGV